MRLRGSAERRRETGETGEEARGGRGGAPETEKPREREMAAGAITTLPALPEDGASGGFPPVNFKEPKRLYCKNGGFFLRIHPDGRVDGIREKSDPHSEWLYSVLLPEPTKTLYASDVEHRWKSGPGDDDDDDDVIFPGPPSVCSWLFSESFGFLKVQNNLLPERSGL